MSYLSHKHFEDSCSNATYCNAKNTTNLHYKIRHPKLTHSKQIVITDLASLCSLQNLTTEETIMFPWLQWLFSFVDIVSHVGSVFKSIFFSIKFLNGQKNYIIGQNICILVQWYFSVFDIQTNIIYLIVRFRLPLQLSKTPFLTYSSFVSLSLSFSVTLSQSHSVISAVSKAMVCSQLGNSLCRADQSGLRMFRPAPMSLQSGYRSVTISKLPP